MACSCLGKAVKKLVTDVRFVHLEMESPVSSISAVPYLMMIIVLQENPELCFSYSSDYLVLQVRGKTVQSFVQHCTIASEKCNLQAIRTYFAHFLHPET